MKLSEYEAKITEIENDSMLSSGEKSALLDMTAGEISGAVWSGTVREQASALASSARKTSAKLSSGDPLADLDAVAAKRLIK